MKNQGDNDSSSQWNQEVYADTVLFKDTQSIQKFITNFNRLFPDEDLQIQLEFQQYQTFQLFQKMLSQSKQSIRSKRQKLVKNDLNTLLWNLYQKRFQIQNKNLQKLKNTTILFSCHQNMVAFYHHYEKRIRQLQVEYNYYIVPDKKNLLIYLRNIYDSKINSLFVNEIFDMKKQLFIVKICDKQLMRKLQCSQIAQRKLLSEGIRFILIPKYYAITFYSQRFNNSKNLRENVKKLLCYHVSILDLSTQYTDQYVLKESMKLLIVQLKPVLEIIQKRYQMPVQINIDKLSILIYDKHQAFTDGYNLLVQNLKTNKLLQIQGPFLPNIKSKIVKTKFSKYVLISIKHRKCFLLISDRMKSEPNILKAFCQQFSTFFGQKYRLVLHLNHLVYSKDYFTLQRSRIINLAAYYQMNIQTYHQLQNDRFYGKIVFQPKQINALTSKLRVYLMNQFLKDFLDDSFKNLQTSKIEIPSISYFDNTINSTCIIQKNNESFITEQICSDSIRIQDSFKKQLIEQSQIQKQDFLNLSSCLNNQITYQLPKFCQIDGYAYKKLKRNRKIQNHLENQWKRKLIVSQIMLNSTMKLNNMKNYDRLTLSSQIFREMASNRFELKKLSQIEEKKLNQVEENENLFLCFVHKQQNAITPIYFIQFLN